jgi:NitT/TauT family transport system permease protein
VKSSFTDTPPATTNANAPDAQPDRSSNRRSERKPLTFKRASTWAIPLIVVIVILVLWQIIVEVLGLKPYFIPTPLKIAETFKENLRVIADNSVPTLAQAVTGFAIGNALAVVMSVWFVHVSSARRALYPLAIILQSIPLVAIAPIFLVTLGDGFSTKVVMTAIISFFPTLVNMMRGLAAVDTNMVQLFQSVDASRWKVLVKLRWPTSLPYLFAGLRHHRRMDQQRHRPRLHDHQLDLPVQYTAAVGLDCRFVAIGSGRVRRGGPGRARACAVEPPE